MKKIISILCLISFSFSVNASTKVIYGEDNRKDLFDVDNNLYLELASSTAAQIDKYSLRMNGDGSVFTISGGSLESRGICKEERFSQQMTAARCSGFLVGDDILVTAGHCVENQDDCNNYSWVFGYNQGQDDSKLAIEVPAESVFKCTKILDRSLDRFTKNDFAVIKLDRKVVGITPLTVRSEGMIEDKEALVVIGHPSGLPAKVADGANVRSNDDDYFFVANLDTYGGNSGSAVFNSTTGEVEGILVRGETDYVYDSSAGCRRSKICASNGCRGEEVTRITNIKKALEKYIR